MKHFLLVAAVVLIATPMVAVSEPTMRSVAQLKPDTLSYNLATGQTGDQAVRGQQLWLNQNAGWFTYNNWQELLVDHMDLDPVNNTSRQLKNNRWYLIDTVIIAYVTDCIGPPTFSVAWYGGYVDGDNKPLPDPNTEGQYFLAAFGFSTSLPGFDGDPNYIGSGWLITLSLYDANDPNYDSRFWIFGPDFYNGITDPNDPNFNYDTSPGLDWAYAQWWGTQPSGTQTYNGPYLGYRDDTNAPGEDTYFTTYAGNDPWVDPNNWADDHWAFVTYSWFGDPNDGYPFAAFNTGLYGDIYVLGCPTPGAHGQYCTADIDGSGDCVVNLGDLSVLLGSFNKTTGDPAFREEADFVEPFGQVDLGDLSVLLGQFNDDCN
jgi:hypothetical protein